MAKLFTEFNDLTALIDPNTIELLFGLGGLNTTKVDDNSGQYEMHSSPERALGLPRVNVWMEYKQDQIKALAKAGFKVPETWYLTNIRSGLQCMPDKKYIVKPIGGANSEGVILANPNDINDMYTMLGSATVEEFNKRFNVTGDLLFKAIKTEKLILQTPVDIKVEYRVIVFLSGGKNDIIVEKRDNYGPIKDMRPDHYVIDEDHECYYLNKRFIGQLHNFVKSKNVPWLAFDVYLEDDSTVGILEYSTVFGTVYPAKTLTRIGKLMTDSILQYIEEDRCV